MPPNSYRERNFRVVANSRSIEPCFDPDILADAGAGHLSAPIALGDGRHQN
jgi:hypothetical protein